MNRAVLDPVTHAPGPKVPEWCEELGLQNSDGPWTTELVHVNIGGWKKRLYQATNPAGKGCLLRSVTDILGTLGAGEELQKWGVQMGLLDVVSWIYRLKFDDLKGVKDCLGGRFTFAELGRMLHAQLGNKSELVELTTLCNQLDISLKARFRTMEDAAALGTETHLLIEQWLRAKHDPDLDSVDPRVANSFSAFRQFWTSEGLTHEASEVSLCDVELGVAGTCDCLATTSQGKPILLDWKTSTSMRESYLLQVAAYARMLERTPFGWPESAWIVRLDKITADIEIKRVYSNRVEFLEICRVWGAVVRLARFMSRIGSEFAADRKKSKKQTAMPTAFRDWSGNLAGSGATSAAETPPPSDNDCPF